MTFSGIDGILSATRGWEFCWRKAIICKFCLGVTWSKIPSRRTKQKLGRDNSILDFQSKGNNTATLFTHKNTKLKWVHVKKGRTACVVHVPTSDLFTKAKLNPSYLFHDGKNYHQTKKTTLWACRQESLIIVTPILSMQPSFIFFFFFHIRNFLVPKGRVKGRF